MVCDCHGQEGSCVWPFETLKNQIHQGYVDRCPALLCEKLVENIPNFLKDQCSTNACIPEWVDSVAVLVMRTDREFTL